MIVAEQLITEETCTEISPQTVNGETESQISAIVGKISDVDSGIGTTEGSLSEGTIISQRRKTLDLTPPSDQMENELTAEEDELSVNRIQEMTTLSEKVNG